MIQIPSTKLRRKDLLDLPRRDWNLTSSTRHDSGYGLLQVIGVDYRGEASSCQLLDKKALLS